MFLTALVLSTLAEPDRWVHVGSGNDHAEFLDRESVRRSGDKVSLWTRRDLAGDQDTLWHEIELDCSTKTDTIIAYIRNERGMVSHNDIRPHRASAPIPPGSVQEKIFNIACR
jgi:hypothetical protein